MTTFAESVANLNAVKEERAHSRVVLPDAAQVDENFRFMAEILEGTGIDQAEIAEISLAVGHSVVQQVIVNRDQMSSEDLIGVIGSVWVDAVAQTANYMKQREAGDGE